MVDIIRHLLYEYLTSQPIYIIKVASREAVSDDEKPLIDTLEADWVINRHCQQKWIHNVRNCH